MTEKCNGNSMIPFSINSCLSPDVEKIIKELIQGIFAINSKLIKGFYLTGSIPLKDFHPGKSDIDFLILCDKLPADELRSQVQRLHARIESRFKKVKLNGFYITPDGLHVHNSQSTTTLFYQEGRIKKASFEMAPITLYELKTGAITVFGTPAQKLNITVEPRDIHSFLLNNINTYWRKWITNHSSLAKQKLLLILFPRLTEWVILGVARQLYTLKTGMIASKTDAGYYCLQHLSSKYHSILHEAIQIRNEKNQHCLSVSAGYYVQPSLKRADKTINCTDYMIKLFNQEYNKLYP